MERISAEEAYEEGLDRLALEKLRIPYLFPYQRLVVSNILDAEAGNAERCRRSVVILPTGAGKSACFQLPALFLRGPTLVVFPLLSLISDQARRLAEAGIGAVSLVGGLSSAERQSLFGRLKGGEARVLLTNPEMLALRDIRDELRGLGFSHLVIDEAHCVSEWGESFRPSYLDLGLFIEGSGIPIITAFTATASPPVLDKIRRHLFGEGAEISLIEGCPDRPNIFYETRECLSKTRELEALCRSERRPIVVFTASRAGTERLAYELRARLKEDSIWFYHAGLSRAEKAKIEKVFFSSTEGVLVATCAYGMGVDKKNIRTVIHFEAPSSPEAYLQESGRAGRDGEPSRAILLFEPRNPSALPPLDETGAEGTRKTSEREKGIDAYARARDGCRRRALLSFFNQELEYCSGCDLCAGKRDFDAPGKLAIVEYVRKNSRRFSRQELAQKLRESLENWRRADQEELLRSLLGARYLRAHGDRAWKGKIAPEPKPSLLLLAFLRRRALFLRGVSLFLDPGFLAHAGLLLAAFPGRRLFLLWRGLLRPGLLDGTGEPAKAPSALGGTAYGDCPQ
jgi:ATP-dependent DNA helicase RecQ